MNQTLNVKYAAKYVSLGWPVYPVQAVVNGTCTCSRGATCPDAGKHPHHALGGLRAATARISRVEAMFANTEANVGLECAGQFWVLDVDGEAGVRDLAELVAEHGDLPRTPTAKTGGGGRHYFFRHNPKVGNRAKINGMSIDTKADGGMVVAAPSRHVSGGEYSWLIEPETISLAEAPPWLIDFVSGKQVGPAKPLTAYTVDDNDLRTAPGVSEGSRNVRLCQLVGADLARHGNAPDLLQAATQWAQRCDPPLTNREVEKIVGNLLTKHLATGGNASGPVSSTVAAQHRAYELTSISFDQIEGKPVEWLWFGRFPLGKLTLLTGDGGVGKSILTCDLAAHVSTGRSFSDGSPCPQGDVLFVGSEDGAEDTIRPRLDAAGAAVSRVHLVRGPVAPGEKHASPVDLSRHMASLDELLAENPAVNSVVIDPVLDYLGAGVNSDKATDVRSILGPLRDLAERHHVAIILINHLNKSGRTSKNRSLGSGAFVHVCRIELRVVEDPDDTSRRLLLPVKNNLAAAPGLAYRIESSANGAGVAAWEDGPVLVSIDEIESNDGSEPKGAREEAIAWLRAQLADGPVLAAEINNGGKRDGISHSTLKRARYDLKVKSYQEDRKWWCRLQGEKSATTEASPTELTGGPALGPENRGAGGPDDAPPDVTSAMDLSDDGFMF